MSMRPAVSVVAAALLLLPAAAFAQRGRPGGRGASAGGRIDTTAEWHVKQRAFLDESKHDWTNDTLRTALLRASGVATKAPLPLQVGVQISGRDSRSEEHTSELQSRF